MTKAVVIRSQRLPVLFLTALRILRHHYFTFVTAGVLAAIVVVVATSSSFGEREPRASLGPTADSIWPKPTRGQFPTRGRSMIYYIVESNEQAANMERALRSDVVYSEIYGSGQDFGRVVYLNPSTPMEEANVASLLNDVVAAAPHGGYVVTIIDLRD